MCIRDSPYGNMKVLPFEEAYYGGGANDIRAWQARTLGPGSYLATEKYPNSVGDFKLAGNIEYRFKLIWLLEGALFVDAGNVWNINPKENRSGEKLNYDFFNQIALGTGAGLRLNANFFLLRFDLGIKVKDPSMSVGNRFVLFDSRGGFRRSVFNAVSYTHLDVYKRQRFSPCVRGEPEGELVFHFHGLATLRVTEFNLKKFERASFQA